MMRRLFPCLMIATLALFGLTACQQAEEPAEAATAAAEAAGAAAEEAVVAAEAADAVAGVQQKISEMSPQDLLTDDGKALKDKADSLMAEIGGLEGELKALME